MKILFFAGKGGVGKTSAAAATGVRAAEMGYRTVVMSLDVAHSLSDIFDLEKNLLDLNKGKPIKVAKNLWIQELDIQEEINKNWGDVHKYLSLLLNTTGLDEILAEARDGDYDLVVIGAHRGEAWRRILLDDLAHQIIVQLDRPVLVVR